ncbi:SDR family NAD(P)-dependent oxidoreductase [Pseudonocardia sp. McavD-2-B]|uniref:SDR family NAD(P)-dependent oxidoreductase n=1 Tax=Pseudonocardia sp. McavD-2-B TaxID=2954499 RepID=UPI0020979E17|nr:SDR family oxidoreductase [Pseudonocardia sp. McavD-2-B]MCO7191980.1 SDR family oxidoreductase [Pseudonocardia sp. McavD-2-B]
MTRIGTCVVVGASGALGSAITARLTARGHKVVAVGRDGGALAKLAANNPGVRPCVADIADDGSVEAIAAELDGPVQMAVFAAGLPVRGSADTIAPSALGAAVNLKAGGVLRLLHAVRDRLEPGSRFVAVGGSLGLEPGPLDAGPGTANAAVFNLMRQISALYGPRGITTHTIAPGPLDTPRLASIIASQAAEQGVDADQIRERYRAKTTLGRLPTLDEVAWTVETLLAPEAAALHAGVITVDGGTRHGVQ